MRNINFKCNQCDVLFVAKKADKNRQPKFCSLVCWGKSRRKDRSCEQCGEHLKWCNKHFCSKKCFAINRTGKKLPDSHIAALSSAKKGKRPQHFIDQASEISKKLSNALMGKAQPWNRGKNHHNYIDGGKKTRERLVDMGRVEYKSWRRAVFSRDDFTCQICSSRGGRICADHIKSYSSYPNLRYDLSNGRTLCVECHYKTDNYGGRAIHFKERL